MGIWQFSGIVENIHNRLFIVVCQSLLFRFYILRSISTGHRRCLKQSRHDMHTFECVDQCNHRHAIWLIHFNLFWSINAMGHDFRSVEKAQRSVYYVRCFRKNVWIPPESDIFADISVVHIRYCTIFKIKRLSSCDQILKSSLYYCNHIQRTNSDIHH